MMFDSNSDELLLRWHFLQLTGLPKLWLGLIDYLIRKQETRERQEQAYRYTQYPHD